MKDNRRLGDSEGERKKRERERMSGSEGRVRGRRKTEYFFRKKTHLLIVK
jgi:hypothetical protein